MVRTPRRILVIENKLLSAESEGQTPDYYDCVAAYATNTRRSAGYLFLSAQGLRPKCQHFRPVSYVELYLLLTRLRREAVLGHEAAHIVDTYVCELSHTFVEPVRCALTRAKRCLEEGCYGVSTRVF